jgi:hypothetical protein
VEGRFYDHTYSAVWNKNKYLGVIVITYEVTRRKHAEENLKDALKKLELANEELRRMDRMKDDFLSNVSHELKTPMISVMGYIGMLLKEKGGALTEQQKRFLDISYKNLLKLGKNIDNLDLAELGIQKSLPYSNRRPGWASSVHVPPSDPWPRNTNSAQSTAVEPVTIPVEIYSTSLFDNLLTMPQVQPSGEESYVS